MIETILGCVNVISECKKADNSLSESKRSNHPCFNSWQAQKVTNQAYSLFFLQSTGPFYHQSYRGKEDTGKNPSM